VEDFGAEEGQGREGCCGACCHWRERRDSHWGKLMGWILKPVRRG
jgi:hypothetical protein